MDRYRMTGFKSQSHYVRGLYGLHEDFAAPQIVAEIEAQALAGTHLRAVIVIERDRDDWKKVVRAGRPATGRGPFLVQGEIDLGNSDE